MARPPLTPAPAISSTCRRGSCTERAIPPRSRPISSWFALVGGSPRSTSPGRGKSETRQRCLGHPPQGRPHRSLFQAAPAVVDLISALWRDPAATVARHRAAPTPRDPPAPGLSAQLRILLVDDEDAWPPPSGRAWRRRGRAVDLAHDGN